MSSPRILAAIAAPTACADLRADHRRHGVVVALAPSVVARHLPALAAVAVVADELRDRESQRQPAHHRGRALAQRRKDPVARLLHGGDGADGGGLLAENRAVEADAALPLQHQHAAVELAHLHHGAVEVEQRSPRAGPGSRPRATVPSSRTIDTRRPRTVRTLARRRLARRLLCLGLLGGALLLGCLSWATASSVFDFAGSWATSAPGAQRRRSSRREGSRGAP